MYPYTLQILLEVIVPIQSIQLTEKYIFVFFRHVFVHSFHSEGSELPFSGGEIGYDVCEAMDFFVDGEKPKNQDRALKKNILQKTSIKLQKIVIV